MKLEEAIGLVEEVRNCSLPWDDAHWEALGIVIDYVKKNKSKKQWKPSEEQMYNLSEAAHYNCAFYDMEILKRLYDDLKQL